MGLFFVACSQSIPSLEKRVTGFWTALVERDRVAAQNFVAPSLRNNFLRHRERRYRSWKILEIEEQSDKRFVVRIGYEGFFEQLQSYQELTESQTWEIIDGEWFLNVDPPEERLRRAIKKIYSSEETTRWETEKDGRVTVNSQIRIPFFNSAQLGTLMIRNGTEKPIRIVEVFLDENLFQISENPAEIGAGQKRQLKILYLGSDKLKNLKKTMTLVLENDGVIQKHSVEIVCNYLSPGIRGILGLTKEAIPNLKREDKVRSAIKVDVPPEQDTKIQQFQEQTNGTDSSPEL